MREVEMYVFLVSEAGVSLRRVARDRYGGVSNLQREKGGVHAGLIIRRSPTWGCSQSEAFIVFSVSVAFHTGGKTRPDKLVWSDTAQNLLSGH